MVMQRLHLISAMTIRANLQLAQRLASAAVDNALIEHLTQALGIIDKLDRYPRQLSQGEAQRAAIARALVNKPALLLADEPTSALDDKNCEAAISLLLDQAALHGATLIVATHDDRIKSRFAHVVLLGAA
jgi:putative ABC transport system ATP-binding protein